MSPKASSAFEQKVRQCYVCKCALPIASFCTITARHKRRGRVYEYVTPSFDCRDCRNTRKREERRAKAEMEGRRFVARADGAAIRAARKAENLAEQQRYWDECAQNRQRIRESERLQCHTCKSIKERAEFQPSRITVPSKIICRSCSSVAEAERFKNARDALSDSYVKRMITKQTRLHARHIPAAMIEAKRIQLLIDRAMPSEADLYLQWTRQVLSNGPMDAEKLNAMAEAAGFDRDDLQMRKARRDAGAVHDAATNTWRMNDRPNEASEACTHHDDRAARPAPRSVQ